MTQTSRGRRRGNRRSERLGDALAFLLVAIGCCGTLLSAAEVLMRQSDAGWAAIGLVAVGFVGSAWLARSSATACAVSLLVLGALLAVAGAALAYFGHVNGPYEMAIGTATMLAAGAFGAWRLRKSRGQGNGSSAPSEHYAPSEH